MPSLAPLVIATSLIVAAISVVLIDVLRAVLARSQPTAIPPGEPPVRFLFDRDRLIDTTPSGEVLLSRLAVQVPSLKSVMDLLKPRFPDIGESIGALDHLGETRLLASDGSAQLTAVRIGETLRLDLQPLSTQESLLFVSAAELAALKAELERLRGVADSLPYLVWCEDRDGRLTWVNRAYLDTCNKFFGPDAADNWPLPRLFDTLPAPEGDDRVSARLRVGPEDSGDPFEVVVTPREGGLLGTAYPADSAVRAERSMRDVLQTLTRTFAQISIGLAVFGRDRRLVLFNPALADLTGCAPNPWPFARLCSSSWTSCATAGWFQNPRTTRHGGPGWPMPPPGTCPACASTGPCPMAEPSR